MTEQTVMEIALRRDLQMASTQNATMIYDSEKFAKENLAMEILKILVTETIRKNNIQEVIDNIDDYVRISHELAGKILKHEYKS